MLFCFPSWPHHPCLDPLHQNEIGKWTRTCRWSGDDALVNQADSLLQKYLECRLWMITCTDVQCHFYFLTGLDPSGGQLQQIYLNPDACQHPWTHGVNVKTGSRQRQM
ncbi:hypothetical protein ACKS0A_08796 [Histoplasma ohiense]